MRSKAKEGLNEAVVRIQDELDRLIKMHVWMREALENEIMEGMGYKQLSASEKDIKKLKELTMSMDALVSTKIRWDKAAKQMAATMTRKEELDAVYLFIRSATDDERNALRDRLHDQGIYKWKS
jgi:hypothetical protein